MSSWQDFQAEHKPLIQSALEDAAAQVCGASGVIADACRYALLGPGKRLRPLCTIAAALDCGGSIDRAAKAGVAVEMVHAYSLVHDDLPAMDDDDMRRGQPTVHKKYGEAAAILVGDALLTGAFEILAGLGNPRLITRLARAAGARSLIAGQAIDLGLDPNSDTDRLHELKTGALYGAAFELGAATAGVEASKIDRFAAFGRAFGIGFQFLDDLHDGENLNEAKAKLDSWLTQAHEVLDVTTMKHSAIVHSWLASSAKEV